MNNIEQLQEVKNDLLAPQEKPENKLHQNLINAVMENLQKTDKIMDESSLWELIAAQNSPDWMSAKEILEVSRADFAKRSSDDYIPLGPIDFALDAGEFDASRNAFNSALSNYTIINEDLRNDAELQEIMTLLNATQAQMRESLEVSRRALTTTQKLGSAPAAKMQKKGYLAVSFKASGPIQRGLAQIGLNPMTGRSILESAKRAVFKKVADRPMYRDDPDQREEQKHKKDHTLLILTHTFD